MFLEAIGVFVPNKENWQLGEFLQMGRWFFCADDPNTPMTAAELRQIADKLDQLNSKDNG